MENPRNLFNPNIEKPEGFSTGDTDISDTDMTRVE